MILVGMVQREMSKNVTSHFELILFPGRAGREQRAKGREQREEGRREDEVP